MKENEKEYKKLGNSMGKKTYCFEQHEPNNLTTFIEYEHFKNLDLFCQKLLQQNTELINKVKERIEETQPKLTNKGEFESWKQGQREAFEEVLDLLGDDK